MRTKYRSVPLVDCAAGALAGSVMWLFSFTVTCVLTAMVNGTMLFWMVCYWTLVGLSSIITIANVSIFRRLADKLVTSLIR